MSKKRYDLSRRKVLASMGVIGAASAGAGLGTSAFFSDQETFANNELTAGALDLKVDWEEHYSVWDDEESTDRPEDGGGESPDDDGQGSFDILMNEPADPSGFTPFPPGTGNDDATPEPMIWVPDEYVDDFMDNTSIEGYPDPDNDGIASFPIEEMGERTPCDFLADVGDDDDGLDPDSDPLGRTDNEDTRLDDGSPAPLINLQDVKPGDFGEITFSTHLCDNPGYLWMNMPGGLETSENGITEPEAQDPDEDEDEERPASEDSESDRVELADKIQTAIWYDNNCDNLVTCDEKIDVMAVADTSDSIEGEIGNGNGTEEIDFIVDGANTFVDELASLTSPDQVRAGLLTFNGPGDAGAPDPSGAQAVFDRPALRAGMGPLSQFDTNSDGNADVEEFLPSEGNGNTPMPHAIDLAQKVLNDQGRPDARQVILLVTDGLPDYPDDSSPTIPYTVEENEGGPLANTGTTYTSEGYDGTGGDGVSGPDEQQETEDEALEIQQDGIEIWVAGIGLDQNDDAFLRDRVAGDDGDPNVAQPNFFFDAEFNPGAPNDINTVAVQLAQTLANGPGECDEVIFRGTLRETAAQLTANEGRGIPLDADRTTAFDELEDPEDSDTRQCFLANNPACFGFAWWLPLNHGNEVQSDGVSFDIGFYTEQCRHNDGSGVEFGNTSP